MFSVMIVFTLKCALSFVHSNNKEEESRMKHLDELHDEKQLSGCFVHFD